MKKLVALLVLLPVASVAKMAMPEDVPVDRLIRNVEAALKAQPNDPDQLFLLARLHSLAYAMGQRNIQVYSTKRGDPASGLSIAPWVRVQPEVASVKFTDACFAHLKASYLTYKRAVSLKPGASLPKLGWGWVNEEAAKHIKHSANFEAPKKLTSRDFTDQAIKLYREIVADHKPTDKSAHRWEFADYEPAYEAAKNLQRLLSGSPVVIRQMMAGEKGRLAKIIADYEARPIVMSPIVFPLVPTPVNRLIDANRTTNFDIAADGIPREWPWVARHTAFLAWDPAATGKIKDGTQLFGNRTFNMFFRDGYAALASLDDNQDGWLTGPELKGIVVWHDRNQNGVSDRGEVTSGGISAIRTKSNGTAGGMLAASSGIQFKSGRIVPTYDWLPRSKAGKIGL